MRFEWGPAKSFMNLEQHRISFATAQLVFDDLRLPSLQIVSSMAKSVGKLSK
jgi:uncharacterized DUF497 family protein